jgi:yecA family protein
MNRYEAYIEAKWRETGLAYVLVARLRDGEADFAVFLVDLWCLGVKDVFHETGVPASQVRELVDERLPEEARTPIHPSCAKKLIEGAVAYAEGLGLAPHREFRKARRVLGGIDAALCPMEISFGRDGRPCFVPGPDDSDERIERVLGILEARLGEDGYDYEPLDEEDDITGIRQGLMEFLHQEPTEVPRFYFLSGLLTAMILAPQPLAPTKAFDVLWPEGREWASKEELHKFTGWVMEYWNYLVERTLAASAPGARPDKDSVIDVHEDDLPEGDDPRPFLAMILEWAGGFRAAVEKWPEAWGDVFERPDLAPHWEIIAWWATVVERPGELAAGLRDDTTRNLGLAVATVVRALAPKPS